MVSPFQFWLSVKQLRPYDAVTDPKCPPGSCKKVMSALPPKADIRSAPVCLGQKQTFAPQKSHVRFTPNSGHSQCKHRCPLRAISGLCRKSRKTALATVSLVWLTARPPQLSMRCISTHIDSNDDMGNSLRTGSADNTRSRNRRDDIRSHKDSHSRTRKGRSRKSTDSRRSKDNRIHSSQRSRDALQRRSVNRCRGRRRNRPSPTPSRRRASPI